MTATSTCFRRVSVEFPDELRPVLLCLQVGEQPGKDGRKPIDAVDALDHAGQGPRLLSDALLDQGQEEVSLVGKVPVDGPLGDPSGARDMVQRGSVVATAGKDV
jgi:hypothetical protein